MVLWVVVTVRMAARQTGHSLLRGAARGGVISCGNRTHDSSADRALVANFGRDLLILGEPWEKSNQIESNRTKSKHKQNWGAKHLYYKIWARGVFSSKHQRGLNFFRRGKGYQANIFNNIENVSVHDSSQGVHWPAASSSASVMSGQ